VPQASTKGKCLNDCGHDVATLAGGDGGTRTRDFLLAKQVLYQLSYVPASPL
jgi:hypothetical protein